MDVATNNMGLIITGVVVGVIVLSIISYYVLRAMKGSMKLALGQKAVSSGQQITGSLSVTTKKALTADRLYIALVGEREEVRRTQNGTKRRWVEFYRDEADILMDEQLPAGFSETYEFTLDTPTEGQAQTGAGAIDAVTKAVEGATDNEMAQQVVKGIGHAASALAGMSAGRKRWKVVSRLETKGVDLATSEKLHVSLKSAV